MREKKYTKGPWIASPYSSVVGAPVVAARSGRPIAQITYFHLGAGFENHERESIANGMLIAAAPDLLEALPDLSHVIAWLENGCAPGAAATELRIYQAKIKAAIRKAYGDGV